MYIGEHSTGSYAIPSLVDQNTPTIKLNAINLLGEIILYMRLQFKNKFSLINIIEGPIKDYTLQDSVVKSNDNQETVKDESNFIIFGHYDVPPINQNIQIQQSTKSIENQLTKVSNINLYKWGKGIITTHSSIISTSDNTLSNENSLNQQNSSVTENNPSSTKAMKKQSFIKSLVLNFKLWFDYEENKVIKLLMIIFIGLIVAMFW